MAVPCPNPKCAVLTERDKNSLILYFVPYLAPWIWLGLITFRDKKIATITTESDMDDYGIHDHVELNICDRCGYRLGDPQPWKKYNRIKRFIFSLLLIFFWSGMTLTLYSLPKSGVFFWGSLFFTVISCLIFWANNDYDIKE